MTRRTHLSVAAAAYLALFLAAAPIALADRTKLRPGINSFSPQQDIQMGRQAAQEVERKSVLCNDPKVDVTSPKSGAV
jgi:predicted Zn-dependent protease